MARVEYGFSCLSLISPVCGISSRIEVSLRSEENNKKEKGNLDIFRRLGVRDSKVRRTLKD